MVRIDTRGGKISASGHAGFSVIGTDIVCSAVSTLVYEYAMYLTNTDNALECVTESGAASVVPIDPEQSKTVHKAIVDMLVSLEKQFPAHISVRRDKSK